MARFISSFRQADASSTHSSSPSLSESIMEADWYEVEKMITCNKALAIASSNCDDEDTPLLLACKHKPTLKVTHSLIQAYPSAVFEADYYGNLPLHVACEYAAPPEVIEKILSQNKDAVYHKNSYGMLPIHVVCRSYYKNTYSWENDANVKSNLLKIIKSLLLVAPTTILEEDDSGLCPIEHAIESSMLLDVIVDLHSKSKAQRSKISKD